VQHHEEHGVREGQDRAPDDAMQSTYYRDGAGSAVQGPFQAPGGDLELALSFDAFGVLGSTAGWVGFHDDLTAGISAGLVQYARAVECMPYATGTATPVVLLRFLAPVIVTYSGVPVPFIRNNSSLPVIRSFKAIVIRPRRIVVVRRLTRTTTAVRAPATSARPRARYPRATRTKRPLRPRPPSSDASPPAPQGRRAPRDRPNAVIAFEAHSPGAKAVREQLVQLRAGKNATVLNVRSKT